MAAPSAPSSRRPGTVTGSAVLLLAQSAAGLAMALIAVAAIGLVASRYGDAAGAGGTAEDKSEYILTARIYCISLIVYSLIAAATSAALVAPVLRGRPAARTATWIACGAFTIGGVCGEFALLLARQMRFGSPAVDAQGTIGSPPPALADLLGLGPWLVLVALALIQIAFVVAAAALLLPRASADFFTKGGAPVPSPVGPAGPVVR